MRVVRRLVHGMGQTDKWLNQSLGELTQITIRKYREELLSN